MPQDISQRKIQELLELLQDRKGQADPRVFQNPNERTKMQMIMEALQNPEHLEGILRDQKPLQFSMPIRRPSEDLIDEALKLLFPGRVCG